MARNRFIKVVFAGLMVLSLFGEALPADLDTCLVNMFNYAKHRDIKSLERMKKRVDIENNRSIFNAYVLALYIASPRKNTKTFIENFPEDYDGIMDDYYERIELKRLTPRFLYSINSIVSLAEKGNDKAIFKVINGYVHSDGVVSDVFCDGIIRSLNSNTKIVLSHVAELSIEERQVIYSCLTSVDSREFENILHKLDNIKATSNERQGDVIKEIGEFER